MLFLSKSINRCEVDGFIDANMILVKIAKWACAVSISFCYSTLLGVQIQPYTVNMHSELNRN